MEQLAKLWADAKEWFAMGKARFDAAERRYKIAVIIAFVVVAAILLTQCGAAPPQSNFAYRPAGEKAVVLIGTPVCEDRMSALKATHDILTSVADFSTMTVIDLAKAFEPIIAGSFGKCRASTGELVGVIWHNTVIANVMTEEGERVVLYPALLAAI